MPKKKEIKVTKMEQKSKIKTSWFVIPIVAIVLLFGVSFWARKHSKVEYIEKNVVNNYVCQIVEFDNDQQLLAVRCFTK